MLNLIDGLFTVIWTYTGKAIEVNPLMSALIGVNPILFILVKIVLVNLGCLLLYHLRSRRLSIHFAVLALVVYAAIGAYHVLMFWLVC